MYALVIDGQIYATDARIPSGARDLDTGAWVTPPGGEWTPELAASVGWLPVVIEPRPDDTDTHTSERNEPALIDGVPTVRWTVRAWTQGELDARAAADALRARYETHEGILDATAALMETAHEDGAAWVQPVGAHDAYPLGRTVTHNGKTWENITPANVWEPGQSGWREVVTEGYPEWVRPTGGHDSYGIGDRVTFEGSVYESTINGNTWSPTEYPAGWTLIP